MRYEGTVYRPPGEWKSYLLQVTVGCSHNACTFCGMYKDKRYRVRPLEEIFEDIALARAAYGDVKRVFLCDGDAVAMDTEELLAVLDRLYETFPSLERVNAYAGPGSTLRKTEEELAALRRAGLVRLYLGVESGSDAVLRAVRKGMDAAGMLEAGRLRSVDHGAHRSGRTGGGLPGPRPGHGGPDQRHETPSPLRPDLPPRAGDGAG